MPEVTPLASEHSISSLSETAPVPLPRSVTFSVDEVAPVTVSVVLEFVALAKLASPA